MLKKLKYYLCLLLFVAIYLPALSSATTYYVDSATGDDTYDGKTSVHAWATVAGGNGVNFNREDKIHIKQSDGVWRIYDAPNFQSHTLASEIITRARYLLNDTSSSMWTDAELLSWVNNGIEDISSRTKSIETKEDITLIDGQLFYDISTEYLSVKGAVYVEPFTTSYLLLETEDQILLETGDGILIDEAVGYKGLEKGSYHNVGHEEDVDEPVYWFVQKDQIGIYPLSDSASGNDTVTLYLIARPYPVTLDANIPLPAIYDSLLVSYVVMQGFFKDGMMASGQMILDEYNLSLDRIRVDFIDRPEESAEINQ